MSTGVIFACGLNNYGQLALIKQAETMEVDGAPSSDTVAAPANKAPMSEAALAMKQGPLVQFMLTPANGFDPEKDWAQFSIGMHHTLALSASGKSIEHL